MLRCGFADSQIGQCFQICVISTHRTREPISNTHTTNTQIEQKVGKNVKAKKKEKRIRYAHNVWLDRAGEIRNC